MADCCEDADMLVGQLSSTLVKVNKALDALEDCEVGVSEYEMRLEALKLAVDNRHGYPSKDIVADAADFYNFLNGEIVTSNIEKLDKIADILADD
jgi:hypothetical protein